MDTNHNSYSRTQQYSSSPYQSQYDPSQSSFQNPVWSANAQNSNASLSDDQFSLSPQQRLLLENPDEKTSTAILNMLGKFVLSKQIQYRVSSRPLIPSTKSAQVLNQQYKQMIRVDKFSQIFIKLFIENYSSQLPQPLTNSLQSLRRKQISIANWTFNLLICRLIYDWYCSRFKWFKLTNNGRFKFYLGLFSISHLLNFFEQVRITKIFTNNINYMDSVYMTHLSAIKAHNVRLNWQFLSQYVKLSNKSMTNNVANSPQQQQVNGQQQLYSKDVSANVNLNVGYPPNNDYSAQSNRKEIF